MQVHAELTFAVEEGRNIRPSLYCFLRLYPGPRHLNHQLVFATELAADDPAW